MEFSGIPIWIIVVFAIGSLFAGVALRKYFDGREAREAERLKEKRKEIKRQQKRYKKQAKKAASKKGEDR